jgi:hypothetical protein
MYDIETSAPLSMQKLILKNANKNRLGADAARAAVVLDNHGAQLSTIDPQSRLFTDTRARNDGFHNAINPATTKPTTSGSSQPIGRK